MVLTMGAMASGAGRCGGTASRPRRPSTYPPSSPRPPSAPAAPPVLCLPLPRPRPLSRVSLRFCSGRRGLAHLVLRLRVLRLPFLLAAVAGGRQRLPGQHTLAKQRRRTPVLALRGWRRRASRARRCFSGPTRLPTACRPSPLVRCRRPGCPTDTTLSRPWPLARRTCRCRRLPSTLPSWPAARRAHPRNQAG